MEHTGPLLPEVVACIGEGREPTFSELTRVAEQICRDVAGAPSAFAWDDAARRSMSLRAAKAALRGGG
jgi:hypothetical protein